MNYIEILFVRFSDAINSGQTPNIDSYLEQCPIGERLELEELMIAVSK